MKIKQWFLTLPLLMSLVVGCASATEFQCFHADYKAFGSVKCDKVLVGTLAGITLAPGAYCFDAGATLTGLLTLDGPKEGVWIFKVGNKAVGALTATNFEVAMAGGASPCHVTWWVKDAVTLTDTKFAGTVLAGKAITLTRGNFRGRLWSRANSITITETDKRDCRGRFSK